MRYLLFIIFILLLQSHNTKGQRDSRMVRGFIADEKTHDGIPFASIRIAGARAGTASNGEGAFVLRTSASISDDVIISCIGYNTARMQLAVMTDGDTIFLRPAVVELPQVTITPKSGLDIVKEVVANIPRNYDTAAVGFTAFYQENVWLGARELSFVEAVADVYHPLKVDKKTNDQIRILKGRKKQIDYSDDPQLYYWLSGTSNGIRGCLNDDLIKYHGQKFNPLNPVNYKYYNYDYRESIHDGDRRLMVIDVNPRRPSVKGLFRMKLHVDEQSLAAARIDFELTQNGIDRVSRKDKGIAYAIMTNVVHASLEYHLFHYSYTYQEYHGKWFLNKVNRHWEINVDSKRRQWENHPWKADANLIVTELNTTPVPITEGDIGASQAPLLSLVGNDFKDDFWEEYNFLSGHQAPLLATDSFAIVKRDSLDWITRDTMSTKRYSNRENGFTRADTLRGTLTPLRNCYDVTFYHLDVSVDIVQHLIKGSNLIRFKVIRPFTRMQIDLYANMKINKVVYQDKIVSYSREFNTVYLEFPEELKAGVESVKIFYEGVPKQPDFSIPMDGGALWDRDSLGNEWAQMVCQGSGASLWWPNKDHLSDEPDSMKIWITVPDDYTEISNGRLLRTVALANNLTRYEWEVSYPINNYNVTYNVGKYLSWNERYIRDADTLNMTFYAMPYHRSLAEKTFAQVPFMFKVFEENFGKYPFQRDGFALVESIYPMEHQSGVCIGKLSSNVVWEEANRLMWHESAHEWWGNAVSCQDLADMWIHEAFATYSEIMVAEARFGKEELPALLEQERNTVSGHEPIVGVRDVNHIHYNITDMYGKGSLVLHTLRTIIHDDKKWIGLLHELQREFYLKTISTTDIISLVNRFLKTDYTWFFQQYLYHQQLPILVLDMKEHETSLVIKYRWKTNVTGFVMPVKVIDKVGHFGWIYPTSQWQTKILKNVTIDEFEVDESNFLIDVEYQSK